VQIYGLYQSKHATKSVNMGRAGGELSALLRGFRQPAGVMMIAKEQTVG
jgi:hypothetical protein